MVTAIVPAAGESRRMGRLKPLLPFGRQTVIEAVVTSLRACPTGEILVVTGHGGAEVAAALAPLVEASAAEGGPVVRTVANPDYSLGMLSSIQRGVAASSTETDWFLIALADQPLVSPAVVEALLAAGGKVCPAVACIPTWADRRGHPILVPAVFREEIAALPPEVGLRELWRRHPEAVRHVPVDDPAVLLDMDTPEDYARALAEFDRRREHQA